MTQNQREQTKAAGNRTLIQARYRAVNSHNSVKFEGFYAKSVTWMDPGLSAPVRGPAAVRKRLEAFLSAFPDLKWKLDLLFTQGDKVCAEFTFTGTQRGELVNERGRTVIPATNRRVRIAGCGVYTVTGGKISASRIYFDFSTLRE